MLHYQTAQKSIALNDKTDCNMSRIKMIVITLAKS